eukprot:TRINITY_DN15964_c0_g2_i2.p1 TRINITY_DN15964_c0_g2~~TRINITY_DN15964_c0_g2_i2.p1  ORF type:complete len:532 (-),score=189.47 TRINITY_DN15964_c0_g2_i2:66-1661(-)
MAHMLGIPGKSTDPCSIQAPLYDYITEKYSAEEAAALQVEFENIQTAREAATASTEYSSGVMESLKRYAAMLEGIETRLKADKYSFASFEPEWHLAFLKHTKISRAGIAHERASILFCIAAAETQFAIEQDPTDKDGIKQIQNAFLRAAWIFEFLKEYVVAEGLINVANDLHKDSLEVFRLLMMGQAQECICSAAINNKMKPNLIARLSAQVSTYFDQTLTLLASASIQASFDVSWSQIVELRKEVFLGLAQYRQGLSCAGEAQASGIPIIQELVPRLEQAVRHLTAARTLATQPKDHTYVESLLAKVAAALTQAKYDNDTLYHEPPKDISTLESIEPKELGKPVPLDLAPFVQPDPFAHLVPAHVHKAANQHAAQVEQLLADKESEALIAISDLESKLYALGLAGQDEHGLSQQLVQQVQQVQAKGGFSGLHATLESIGQVAQANAALVEEVGAMLDKEEADDQNYRMVYGARWQPEASCNQNKLHKSTVAQHRKYISEATVADKKIKQTLEAKQPVSYTHLTLPTKRIV